MKIINILPFLLVIGVALASYSPKDALDMAYMAGIAYQSADSIDKWSCPDCAKYKIDHPKSFYNSATSIQGFTGYVSSSNHIIIAFRGSTDIRNWITDLDAVTISYPFCTGCLVHKGFYTAYNSISATVKQQVQKLIALYTNAKMIFTGHSLGAALAVICALDFHRTYKRFDHLTTFGQPRVGQSNFASYLTKQLANTFRVIDYADIVVHVPPSAFGFKHGGNEIWYSPRGMQTYRICVSEDPNCANSISSSQFSTDDHNLDNYKKIKTLSSFPDIFSLLRRKWRQKTTNIHHNNFKKSSFQLSIESSNRQKLNYLIQKAKISNDINDKYFGINDKF